MADYSFSPQFANLTGLQPLPAIDVTRGGALQFQALQPIQVVSSRPELVAEGIAGAVSNIAKGALSGITAKWEKEEKMAEEKRKFAQEEKIARIKAAQSFFEKGQQRGWEWEKMHEQDRLIKERMKGVSPGKGFFGSEDAVDESGDFGTEDTSNLEGDLPKIDPLTGEDISGEVDLTSPPQEIPADGAKTSGIPISEQQAIAKNVAMQVPSALGGALSTLGVGTGPIPVPEKTEEKPSLTLQGIEPIVSPEKGQEIAQARIGLREAISESKKPVKKSAETETLQAGFYPITSEAEANKILSTPLAENVHPPERVVDSKTGKLYYEVKQMSPVEIEKQKADKEEAERKAKIASEAPAWSDKQVSVYDKLYSNVQQNPLIKNAIDAKSSQQLVKTSLKEDTGFGDIAAINAFQRMVDPGVAVREGDINLMQQAIPRLERMGLNIQGWVVGDRLTKKGRSEMLSIANNLAASRISSGGQAIEDLRTSAKNAGIDPDLIVRPIEFEKKTEPATESKFKVGQQIENKSTGEKLEWDGTKWVPVK